jgi:uncharacterized membrane protein
MALQQLETKLDEVLNKKAPVKLPESVRKNLANNFWWIALILGILQLWAAWTLWHLAHYLDPLYDRAADFVNSYYGYTVVDNDLNMFYYVAIGVLIVDAIILLLATPGLKAHKKTGWNFLFYSLILNVAYGIIRIFSDVGGGFGAFLWVLVVTTVTAYFIFQIRDYFTGAKAAHSEKPKEKAKDEKEE